MAARFEERSNVRVLQGLVPGAGRLSGLQVPGTGSLTVLELLALGSDGAGTRAAPIVVPGTPWRRATPWGPTGSRVRSDEPFLSPAPS